MFEFDDNTPDGDEELLNITSMVDVVFILLAFFVISAQFVGQEMDFTIDSRASSESSGAAAEDLPPSIPIHLRPGESGVRIGVGQIELPVGDFAAITERLNEINLPEVPVVIASDKRISVDDVSQAIDAVLLSAMKNVTLDTLQTAEAASGE